MKQLLFTALTLALLTACGGQNASEPAAGQASGAASASAASEAWITSTQSNEAPAASEPAPPAPASLPATVETPAVPAAQAASATAGSGGKLAAECEAFINRMSACYDKLPPDTAEPMKATLQETRNALSEAAADGAACKTMSQEFDTTAATLQCE
ncbi:MAG: hypothetical protein Q4C79_06205 [Neisseria sp.]|uniref:hypothetical protein n=1 Tax=Neisseria sp. TaxID=192066 RepID=UPI0026DBA586|nr:hypothetical protein [Neisseria sp.]MDO4248539.1 hypothetical protein [Neisseria sp.]